MIDALDECDSDEVRDMVHFFEDLETFAIDQGHYFRVLFASRHYPHITVRKGVKLNLDGQEGHEQDIANYISDKINIGKSPGAKSIAEELQRKAEGIFMWVFLVVRILNKQFDNGTNTASLWKELQRIPPDLHALLQDILSRDEDNREEMLSCIQWILFAQRQLSPIELYFAIHYSSTSELDDGLLEWDPEEFSTEQVNKFILATSKGLAEVTRSKIPTVQFIHESVNDFLLKK
ncbi:ankyrin repeat domain-containing protein 50 [Microdochium nivale]|nr:ankyrin repeat domain-containing protein 50 [Microdochium nivale]